MRFFVLKKPWWDDLAVIVVAVSKADGRSRLETDIIFSFHTLCKHQRFHQ
jgi:hypothetical protein